MKLRYRIRRLLFPRKHDKRIIEICLNRKIIRGYIEEIEKYRRLMDHGIIGDSLWENFHILCENKEWYERKNEELKKQLK